MLSKETRNAILEMQKMYPEKRSALIPALHLAQAEIGYLPREVQIEVAELFEIDENEVTGVVSFYDMFFEKPVGKHPRPELPNPRLGRKKPRFSGRHNRRKKPDVLHHVLHRYRRFVWHYLHVDHFCDYEDEGNWPDESDRRFQ